LSCRHSAIGILPPEKLLDLQRNWPQSAH
jgi:hypothetical protein